MDWSHSTAYFFGAALLTNAIPHFVSGCLGRPFQTPFAKPPGEGLSSSTVNILWGWLNLVGAYILLCRIGDFDAHATPDIVAVAFGLLLAGLFHARHFGRFHGGNAPESL